MEKALRYELAKSITEIKDSIYPTNAPETATKPYLVYTRTGTQKDKTLEGVSGKQELSFMLSIMATEYADMHFLTKKVEDFLIALPKTSIGLTDYIYVEDLTFNNITETYEFQLGVNRGIVDFTIYY